jgi:hypothetical protein
VELKQRLLGCGEARQENGFSGSQEAEHHQGDNLQCLRSFAGNKMCLLILSGNLVIESALVVLISAVLILGIWQRILQSRARSWPIAQAIIDSARVQKYSRKGERWIARVDYSFQIPSGRRTGRYSRRFNYEDDAEDFVRDLQGKPLIVHYSPRWPISIAREEEVQILLQSRPPQPPSAPPSLPPAPVLLIKKIIAYPMMPLALAGFVLSLYIHVAAWLGRLVLDDSWMMWLHVGMFVPFFTALLLSPKNPRRRRDLRDSSRGFLGTAMIVLLCYAVANFIVFVVYLASDHGHATRLWEWRGFSGHWMLFYFWSFAFLYDAVHPQDRSQS